MLSKRHEEIKFDPTGIHICKDIRLANKAFEVAKVDKMWLMIDNTVKVNGTDCNYATGIGYCPFCGEKLS